MIQAGELQVGREGPVSNGTLLPNRDLLVWTAEDESESGSAWGLAQHIWPSMWIERGTGDLSVACGRERGHGLFQEGFERRCGTLVSGCMTVSMQFSVLLVYIALSSLSMAHIFSVTSSLYYADTNQFAEKNHVWKMVWWWVKKTRSNNFTKN